MIPTHLIARPGDRRSLCGVKDPLPVMWARWVGEHQARYEFVVCAECEEKRGE